jgi:hypothetical protein
MGNSGNQRKIICCWQMAYCRWQKVGLMLFFASAFMTAVYGVFVYD